MKIEKQMSETYFVGTLLAMVGGYLDAYTYLCRGHVFANAQTGNMVLLGIEITKKNYGRAIYYLIPVISFFIGILVAEKIKNTYKENLFIHWRQITIGIECIVLFIVSFIPDGKWNTVATVFISFVCSLQVQSFRKMNGNLYSTTMCTGNLRSATEQLYHYKKTRNKESLVNSIEYFGIILFFIIGAIVGTWITHVLYIKSILFCCGALMLIIGLMFITPRKEMITKEAV